MSCDLFKDELVIFRTEANSAAQFLYASLAVNALASEHPRVLKRLSVAPLFWNSAQASLQKSAIIAPGRIFDNDSLHNVSRLLKKAEDLGIFSKEALGRRKQGTSASPPEWLEEYLTGAHELSAQDIRKLRNEVREWRRVYETNYKPLRDKVYAHREFPNDAEELHALLASTRVEELERMCTFLISLQDALWELYENGMEPVVEGPAHSVLEMLSATNRGRSASELIVKQVRDFFLDDLR
jgi:hypothetical protein